MCMYKIIKCPKCGYEYLPGEIFNPWHFLGQPKNIVRNRIGEVLGYEGIEHTPIEEFVCVNCDHQFKVTAKVNFVTDEDKQEKYGQVELF